MQNTHSYLPLTRKYRPSAFSQILAQGVFAEILTKAILTNQLAHAYMLTGMRGIGKTSFARVIAQTISCTNQLVKQDTITPCGECKNCTAYKVGNHPDIAEMDAASHTGIDDVRNIIDDADYKPLLGKYKIYIIDEVHMLSKGAFNALLKIIEEPPFHLIFIFATTEIQKVPPTIISRCQRFDLKRFSNPEIVGLLEDIAQKEKIPFEKSALETIALKSQGSARDALSLLDQAQMSIKGNEKITIQTICKITGALDLEQVISVTSDIFNAKINEALKKIELIYCSSADLASLLEGMLEVICLCCKLKIVPQYPLEQYLTHKEELLNIITKTSLTKLTLIWQLNLNCLRELKDVSQYLQNVEMLIMKILCVLEMNEHSSEHEGHTKSRQHHPIFAVLEHLYEKRWFELYYYLMNEVEVILYEGNILKISKEGSKEQLNQKLTEALKFVNPVLKVEIETMGREPITLKQQLVKHITSTNKWDILKNLFNVEEISDIIFCKDMPNHN
jgi:DNA polymerase III subunit gamma/tau